LTWHIPASGLDRRSKSWTCSTFCAFISQTANLVKENHQNLGIIKIIKSTRSVQCLRITTPISLRQVGESLIQQGARPPKQVAFPHERRPRQSHSVLGVFEPPSVEVDISPRDPDRRTFETPVDPPHTPDTLNIRYMTSLLTPTVPRLPSIQSQTIRYPNPSDPVPISLRLRPKPRSSRSSRIGVSSSPLV
jgi:hypothetical protein